MINEMEMHLLPGEYYKHQVIIICIMLIFIS